MIGIVLNSAYCLLNMSIYRSVHLNDFMSWLATSLGMFSSLFHLVLLFWNQTFTCWVDTPSQLKWR